MAEMSVTQSLFGLNPDALSEGIRNQRMKQDSDEAYRMAQLTPEQQARFLAARGGAQAGRAVVELGQGLMGVDPQPRQVRLAQATQGILRQMQQEGFDPNDTVGLRKELAKRLGSAGFHQEAAMVAQEAQEADIGTRKVEAEILAKRAAAVKDSVEAKRTPDVRFAETGKYTPESVDEYRRTGDVGVLKLIPGWKEVETTEGVFLVPDGVAAFDANNKKIRIGGTTKNMGDKTTREAQSDLRVLIAETLKPGETVDEMLLRLEREDPLKRNDIVSKARMAYGSEHMMKALGTMERPTEGELKLMTYVPRMMREYDSFAKSFNEEWGGKSPINIADISDTMNVIRQVNTNNPGQMISSAVILNKISDPKKRKFITDAMSVFYPDVRLQTGAAIAASEWLIALEQMLPYADDPDNGQFKLNRMRDSVKDQYRTLEATPDGRRFISRNKMKFELYDKKDEKGAAVDEKSIVAAGRAAKGKGPEAYREWYLGLSPDQKNVVKKYAKKP